MWWGPPTSLEDYRGVMLAASVAQAVLVLVVVVGVLCEEATCKRSLFLIADL